MSAKVLFVDDDPRILTGLRRELEDTHNVHTALGGRAGIETLETEGDFDLIVSDLRMPEMDGVEFLSEARKIAPDSIRIMLTGNADLQAAMDAVNQGRIFRFLTKPCPPHVLVATIEAAVEQRRLITAERELLESTLNRSIEVLCDILAMVNPVAFSRSEGIHEYVNHIVSKLDLPNKWQYELAAMLSQIGCVTLTPDLLEKVSADQQLSEAERAMFGSHPKIAARLVNKIPRLEQVADMIALQNGEFSGLDLDDEPGERKPEIVGAQILAVAAEYDRLLRAGSSAKAALSKLLADSNTYDPAITITLNDIEIQAAEYVSRTLALSDLATGMIIDDDVMTNDGRLLVTKGMAIGYALLERLRNYGHNDMIARTINVRVPQHRASMPVSS